MRRLRLRTLLAVLVLVTTIPGALFAAWLIANSSAQQQALIDRQNIEVARAISAAVDNDVEATIASLGVLALLEPVDTADKAYFSEIAARMLPLHPGWVSVRLIDTSMNVLASTPAPPADSPTVNAEWVRRVISSGRPAVSDVVPDPVTREWTVSVGVPVRRGDTLTYVIGATLRARTFTESLARQAPRDGVVTLLDTTQHIVARSRNEDRYAGQLPPADFVERSRWRPEGTGRTQLLEGTRAYTAWSRSDLTGWTVGIGLPSDPVDAPIRRSLYALVTAGLAICGAGLVGALLLGRRLVATQAAAAAAARALARGDAMPPFDSHIAEAHDLSVGLRDAAAILDTRLRERDEAQAEADRNRGALLDRETSARRAAEALNRAKDEFIATVSHELRTPLNAIHGWVAMLRTGTLDGARQAHALEVIDRNTRAQTQLIEDLLDMSRFLRGGVRLDMAPLDLSAVLDAAVESLRPTADARRIAIHVEAPHGVALVSGDPGRLQQVLWNLLSNAVKFTPPDGRIDAQVMVEDGEAVVRIRDSGEGIAPEFLPLVFDRFRQEDADVTRTHTGLGLGLSLVRHFTELHGGTVAAASEGKGHGATFTIRLPLLGCGALAGASAPAAAPVPLPADTLRDRHILVVDDQTDARELAAETLGQAGAHVMTAASADEAVAALDGRLPDAIVADIGLPIVSGYELAHRLRHDPRTARVPMIALTAYSAGEVRDAALAAGFTAYIRKPYDPRALVALVAGLIRTE